LKCFAPLKSIWRIYNNRVLAQGNRSYLLCVGVCIHMDTHMHSHLSGSTRVWTHTHTQLFTLAPDRKWEKRDWVIKMWPSNFWSSKFRTGVI
jgi:hypothetical protein